MKRPMPVALMMLMQAQADPSIPHCLQTMLNPTQPLHKTGSKEGHASMTRCTPAFTVALLLTYASHAAVAFVRPPLYPCSLSPFLVPLHATEPTRDVFTASLFEDTAADPLRQDGYWEQLFTKGSSVAAPKEASPVSLFKESTMPALEGEGVEVVSFDLDDTLWCGKTVISNANKYVWMWVERGWG